ncbi:hypothetical protein H8356DRAFT_1636970 [Neocallimastix lanati (nom. inval.)]|jgi:hypothetical protein|uniref:Uncharacterized protein n=1 Tax=Neocallimastix californiae TaxID=1754190 RepID=A0A1Y2ASN9_9FUNG|nr:hypothetical protein H8356DRAFT_1636970 [Neocallimastix sp. JGI-2020a]ORY25579.1 hypothetical protein LY90DRAFT_706276 [Neocallimastix californiae]|eukprot:ORY25579.1 hypothetical protein LY90DRAFT_706276 [Neocallimastix californiae]
MSFSRTPFISSPSPLLQKKKEQKKKEPLFKDIPIWVKKENIYFNKLLQDIEEKNLLESNGSFTRLKEYYDIEDYKSTKKEYLENKLLYELVLDLVNGVKVADSTGNMNEVNKAKCYEIINNLIKCEQIKQNLEMIPNEKNDMLKLEEMKNDIMNRYMEEEVIQNNNNNTINNNDNLLQDNNKKDKDYIIGKEKSLMDLTLNIEDNSFNKDDNDNNENNQAINSLGNVNFSNINTNILGLTEEIVNDKVSVYNKDFIKKAKRLLISDVNLILTSTSNEITHFYYGKKVNDTYTQDMLNAQFNEIPKSVAKELKNINEQLMKIDNNNFILVNLFHDFIKFYCEALGTLYKILIHHKCQKYTELNAAFNNYYSAIIENIFLKLNVLKVEIMESLYTEETISALINIRETFLMKKEEVENQLNILNERLMEYEYAGEEFNELATNYSNIINEIRIMNNDIEKMNQS